MRLNLHLLRVFHHVAREGSFSEAARQLCISQPAVSKAVSELERQLDTMLIERTRVKKTGPSLALTDAGLALNAHARAIFSLEHAAIEDLQARSGLKRGELIIGASTTIASYWLPRYLQSFSRLWPDIILKIVAANTQTIVEDLYDCRLDMALVEGPVQKEGVAYYPWKEERLVIVAPPGFFHTQPEAVIAELRPVASAQKTLRVSERDLCDSTWLMRETGSGTREVVLDLLERQGMQPRRTIEIGSNEGIARGVAAGLGVAMLPFAVVEDLLLLGRLIELHIDGMPGLSRSLYRLERKDRPTSRVVGAFLDVLSRPA